MIEGRHVRSKPSSHSADLPLWCLGFSRPRLCSLHTVHMLLSPDHSWVGIPAGLILRAVSDLQDTFVKGRTCWWTAAVMSTSRAPGSTAVMAACPTAAAALTSTAFPAACSPTRCGELLLLLHLLLSVCLYFIIWWAWDSSENRTQKGSL